MPVMCETGSIIPYVPSTETPWNIHRALHVYRRLAFGANVSNLNSAVAMEPLDFIDSIIDEAASMPPTTPPEWLEWSESDYTNIDTEAPEQYVAQYMTFVNDLNDNGFRDKLTLFWHNHFVTLLDVYVCPSYQAQYYNLLQTHALGNFKTFVREVGLTPAMLIFLNGFQNTDAEPNENYARELYELFTLGENNGYTQEDIEETARAFTGYVDLDFGDFCGPIVFNAEFFDDGSKTIFGQTDTYDYDGVIDLLFEQRGDLVAQYICGKLYQNFVSPEINEEIVNALAETFIANEFELLPVYQQLFKSEHFFDNNIVGVIMKSPYDVLLGVVSETNFGYNQETLEAIAYMASSMGQALYDPVDVAGWQGNHDWINSNTLTARWQMIDYYIFWAIANDPDVFVTLAVDLIGESNDPFECTQIIVDHFVPNGLQTVDMYESAMVAFKWEVPENYFETGIWNLTWDTVQYQVAFLLQHISRLPEFQLM